MGGTATLSGIAGAGVGTFLSGDRRDSLPLQGTSRDTYDQVPDEFNIEIYNDSFELHTFTNGDVSSFDLSEPSENEILIVYTGTGVGVALWGILLRRMTLTTAGFNSMTG